MNGQRVLGLVLAAGLTLIGQAAAQPKARPIGDKLDRTVLPIAEPKYPVITELDARKAKAPPRFEVKPPAGAPNVVIILIDDIGFGQASTFGGGISMPTLDRLAAGGLRYNQFHTAALCSPTRMGLKTGRNHHSTNTGAIMETATAFPGNTGQLPNDVAPLAEMLRLNGYSTGTRSPRPSRCPLAGPPSRSISLTTAGDAARAARARSRSTGRRLPRGASPTRTRTSSRRTRRPTWGWTRPLRSPRTTRSATTSSPARSRRSSSR